MSACDCTSHRTCAVCIGAEWDERRWARNNQRADGIEILDWLCPSCQHTVECCKGTHKPFPAMTEGHLCEGPDGRP